VFAFTHTGIREFTIADNMPGWAKRTKNVSKKGKKNDLHRPGIEPGASRSCMVATANFTTKPPMRDKLGTLFDEGIGNKIKYNVGISDDKVVGTVGYLVGGSVEH
jgi:hypothetical protein